jgi:transposase
VDVIAMPKLLYARPPANAEEEQKIRKLAGSRHAPADWVMRARMILLSWGGARTSTIAGQLCCHMQTVRERLARFNTEGVDGLGDRPGMGRRPRITEAERGRIIALARSVPSGRPQRSPGGDLAADDETGPPQWTTVDAGHADRGGPERGHQRTPQPVAAHPARREGALAAHPVLGGK